MTVRRITQRDQTSWVFDRRFGGRRTIRKAKVQTRRGAEAEEIRAIQCFAEHGCLPWELPQPVVKKPAKAAVWEDAVAYYREHVLPGKKPSTRRGYAALLDGPQMREWEGVQLAAIDRPRIEDWSRRLSGGGATRANHHIVLNNVLRAAVAGKLLARLPDLPTIPKRGSKVLSCPSPEDVALLLGPRPHHVATRRGSHGVTVSAWECGRLARALASEAGLRAGEIRGLKVRDVDFRARRLVIRRTRNLDEHGNWCETPPKSGHERQQPITDLLLHLLTERCRGLEPTDYVSVSSRGQPWGESGILQNLISHARACGVEGSRLHGLRHYYASILAGRGTPAAILQRLLGHHSLSVTQRYVHTTEQAADEAVARAFNRSRTAKAAE